MKKENSQILLVAIAALISGFIIAKIDTSQNCDDTAITAALVFIVSAALGFFYRKQAWLWAVLIASPIVLLNILISKNYGSLVALAVAFVGAYIGFLMRSLTRV